MTTVCCRRRANRYLMRDPRTGEERLACSQHRRTLEALGWVIPTTNDEEVKRDEGHPS